MNPANRTVKQDIEKWLESTLKEENFKNYVVNITGNSAKGDNYLGDITFVEVCGETENKSLKKYNLVIKCGKKSDELRKIIPIRSAFQNEIYFYKEVLPILLKFQEEHKLDDPFNNIAKCFGSVMSENMEVLILEDMTKSNYSLHDRSEPMNEDHIKLVMKTYGKYHAISYALRDQKPEIFNKLAENLVDIFEMIVETSKTKQEPKTNVYHDIEQIALQRKEFLVAEKIAKMKENTDIITTLRDPTDPYAVILHGDCWNNNFMFKYDSDQQTKPLDVCFLDFQISKLASPVVDLSYFLFCSISKEDLNKFDEFIGVYYESLSNSLRKLGSDPERVFPFEELMRQWKRFGQFGLVMLPSIIRICVADKDEVNDLAEVADSGQKLEEVFVYTAKNIKEYENRTLPVFKMAVERGFM